MKKRIAGLLFALVLCLTLLPSAASAADGDDVVYVGGVELTGSTDNPVYATTDASGNVITEGASADDYNVKWDGATLTLNGAYITDGHDITPIFTNGIYSNGSLNIVLTGTNTITRAAEPQAYYHVFGISTGSDLSITGSDETAKLIISGSDAADHGSTGINAGSRLYIKNCVIHSSGHDEIEPGYTGIFAEEDLIIENSTVTAESTGVYGCGMYSYAGDIRIDEASHVTATSEAEGGAVKLSDSGALYVGDAAYELDENAAKLEVKDGAVTEGAKIKAPYVNGVSMLAAANNTVSCGDGSAVYNPATNTLTLNNAEITAEHDGCGIYSDGSLTIELIGKNTVGGDGTALDSGVKVEGNLTFTGDGSLAAEGESDGIYVKDNLTVDGGAVSGTATDGTGIHVSGGLTVDSGSVSGSGGGLGGNGVFVSGGLTINDGSVTGSATDGEEKGGVYVATGGLTVNDGSLTGTAGGEESDGVYVDNGGLTVEDGTVTGIAADGCGVYVYAGGITVKGGSLTGESSCGYGICALDDILVYGGEVSGETGDGFGVFAFDCMPVYGGEVIGETARAWAMESGVSDGTDAGGSLTREQLAAMLYRFAGEPETAASLDGFTDAASVSDWAARAMAWAVGEGIITGVTDTALDPQGSATRAQCAAMLMRFVESA